MIAEVLIGVTSVGLGSVIGHYQGYLMGRKMRSMSETMDLGPVFEMPEIVRDPDTCLCKHDITSHRQGLKNDCLVLMSRKSDPRDLICACNGFVGKPLVDIKVQLAAQIARVVEQAETIKRQHAGSDLDL